MPLKLMYITNSPMVATIAEQSGVDRIWIDLEHMGKEERQRGMNSVKSNHKLADVAMLRPYVKNSELMVRVNPLHENSRVEIDEVITSGADLVMLPMFRTVDDAFRFVDIVGGRAKVMLLVETAEAIENLDEIVKVSGIDEIHIGLNDLHLAYGLNFMFELVADGTIDKAGQGICLLPQ
jgi:2-keto-3-deoxy-L-rhamnonate aldolase RhmA